MPMKEIVFSLILLMQACSPLLAQTPIPEGSDSAGILQRLVEKASEAKAKVQRFGGTVLDLAGMYYEEHVQPVTHSYVEWASNVKGSVWKKIQKTIDDYMPQEATSPADQQPQH